MCTGYRIRYVLYNVDSCCTVLYIAGFLLTFSYTNQQIPFLLYIYRIQYCSLAQRMCYLRDEKVPPVVSTVEHSAPVGSIRNYTLGFLCALLPGSPLKQLQLLLSVLGKNCPQKRFFHIFFNLKHVVCTVYICAENSDFFLQNLEKKNDFV